MIRGTRILGGGTVDMWWGPSGEVAPDIWDDPGDEWTTIRNYFTDEEETKTDPTRKIGKVFVLKKPKPQ